MSKMCCSVDINEVPRYHTALQLGLYLILFPSLGGVLLPALIIVPAPQVNPCFVPNQLPLL